MVDTFKGGGDLGHPKTHFDDPKYLEWAKSDQYSSFSRWKRWWGQFWLESTFNPLVTKTIFFAQSWWKLESSFLVYGFIHKIFFLALEYWYKQSYETR